MKWMTTLCAITVWAVTSTFACAAPKPVTPEEVCPLGDTREECQKWRAGGAPPSTPGSASAAPSKILSSPISVDFNPSGFYYFDLVIASSCAEDANPLRLFAEQFLTSAVNLGFAKENRSLIINMSIKGVAPGQSQEIATIPLIDFKTDNSGGVKNARCEPLLVKNLFIQQDVLLEFTVTASEKGYEINPIVLGTVRAAAAFAPYIGPLFQLGDAFVSKAKARSDQVVGASTAVNEYLTNFKVQKTDVRPIQLLQKTKAIAFTLPGGSKFEIAKKPKPYALFEKGQDLSELNIGGVFANQTGLDLLKLVKIAIPNDKSFVAKDEDIVVQACSDLGRVLDGTHESGNAKRYLTSTEASVAKRWILKNLGALPELTRTHCVSPTDLKVYKNAGLDADFLKPAKVKEPTPSTTEGQKPAFEKLDEFLTRFFTEIQIAQRETKIFANAKLEQQQLKSLTEARVFRVSEYISDRADVASQSGPLVFDTSSNVADGYAVAANLINRTSMERFGCYRRSEGDLRKSGIEAEALFLAIKDGSPIKVNALIGPSTGGKYNYLVSKLVTEEASPKTLKTIKGKFANGCGESGTWKPWE